MSLKLVVPKTFPSTSPLRIIVPVPSFLLLHFDPTVAEGLGPDAFLEGPSDHAAHELARRALTTCFGPDAALPPIHKTYVGRLNSDEWSFKIYLDCDVPAEDKNPPVVAFYARNELDENGDVEFLALLPKTEKARQKHNYAVAIPQPPE